MSLPAETGLHIAPDRLSAWPMKDGRYGLDAIHQRRTLQLMPAGIAFRRL